VRVASASAVVAAVIGLVDLALILSPRLRTGVAARGFTSAE